MRPIVNPDAEMSQEMRDELNWFETLCRIRGVKNVSTEDVVHHLMEDGRDHLAMAFSPEMLS